jgi:hypothetical protein
VSERQLVNSLRAHGFELARQRKHRVYKNSAGSTFVIPSTPSDRRWSANALADLARLCGPAETDSRPLRARRQHGRLDSVEPYRDAIDSALANGEVQPTLPIAPVVPALSRADQQRLKRWEKHESQRGAKPERRLAKLRELAYRAHHAIQCGGDRRPLIVSLTKDTYYRVRQLGFQDVALSVAEVAMDDGGEVSTTHAVAIYVRVGSRFVDILEGILREGPKWTDDDNALVDVWADLRPGDFAELNGQQMYLGSGWMDPSRLRLELKIPDGQTVELALFQALLSYEEGVPPVIFVNGELMHGTETLKAHAAIAGGATLKVKVIHLTGDAQEISRAFNAEDCDWPEMLEAVRSAQTAEGFEPNVSYIAWLKYEIAKRLEETNGAS